MNKSIRLPRRAAATVVAVAAIGVLLGDHWDGKKAVQVAPLSTLSDTAKVPAAVNAVLKVTSPVTDTAATENASASTKLVGLPKLHVPVTAPRTVPPGTTGTE